MQRFCSQNICLLQRRNLLRVLQRFCSQNTYSVALPRSSSMVKNFSRGLVHAKLRLRDIFVTSCCLFGLKTSVSETFLYRTCNLDGLRDGRDRTARTDTKDGQQVGRDRTDGKGRDKHAAHPVEPAALFPRRLIKKHAGPRLKFLPCTKVCKSLVPPSYANPLPP